ncbi:MAG: hypothetical protein NTX53_00955 [candidate division WOR-3 bacterium]|nr:hypothetical protein [candidate division WOR-3 bacterium]
MTDSQILKNTRRFRDVLSEYHVPPVAKLVSDNKMVLYVCTRVVVR